MRQLVGALLAIVVIGVFIVSVQNRGADDKTQQAIKQERGEAIIQIEEEIDASYPSEPVEVVEAHSKLMKLLYGSSNGLAGEMLEDYVRTIRKLYSADFLNLNPYEKQLESLQTEMSDIQSSKMKLLSNQTKEIYIIKDETGKETRAEINVNHVTNGANIIRTYYLVKESGMWKINSWEDIESVE